MIIRCPTARGSPAVHSARARRRVTLRRRFRKRRESEAVGRRRALGPGMDTLALGGVAPRWSNIGFKIAADTLNIRFWPVTADEQLPVMVFSAVLSGHSGVRIRRWPRTQCSDTSHSRPGQFAIARDQAGNVYLRRRTPSKRPAATAIMYSNDDVIRRPFGWTGNGHRNGVLVR